MRELELDHRLEPVDVRALEQADLDQSHGPGRIATRPTPRRLAADALTDARRPTAELARPIELERAPGRRSRAELPAYLADLAAARQHRLRQVHARRRRRGRPLGRRVPDRARRRVERPAGPGRAPRRHGRRHVRRAAAGGPRVLLIGHMDTVFDPGTAAERPFRDRAEGIANGPGVTDMKSGLLAGLYALKAHRWPRGRRPAVRAARVRRQPGRGDRLAELDAAHPRARRRRATSASSSNAPARTATSCRRARASSTCGSRSTAAPPTPASSPRRAATRSSTAAGPRHATPRPQRPLAGRHRQRRGDPRRDAAERRRRARASSRSTSARRPRAASRRPRRPSATIAGATERCRTSTVEVEADGPLVADGEARAVAAGSSTMPGAWPRGSGSRSPTPRPAARPTRTRPRAWASRRSTGSARSAGNDHSPAEYLEVDSIVPRTTLLAGAAAGDRPRSGGRSPGASGDPRRRDAVTRPAAGTISSGGPWEAALGYSRAVVVGDTCWVAGTTDAGPDGRSQHPGRRRRPGAGRRSRSSSAALAEAGFALADVVRTRMYVTDPADARRGAGGPRRGVRRHPAGGDDRRGRAG